MRQSARKKGFASEMLCQVIDTERAKSIFSLLVTCDEDNVGSEKTILRGGFILKDFIEISPDKPRKKRFWRRIGSGT